MDGKKFYVSTTSNISKRAHRLSSQKLERSPSSTDCTAALDNSVKKKSHFKHSEASAYFRDSRSSPSYKSCCQLEEECWKQDEPGLQNRGSKRPSTAHETVIRYLNDQPAIDALQKSNPFLTSVTPTKSEEEKAEKSRDKYAKMSLSIEFPDAELKDPHLAKSSNSSASASSAHRRNILKHHQHDGKLGKLKEQVRKQWKFQKEQNVRGQFQDCVDHPVIAAAVENTVTPKVRKVTAAPSAPSYKEEDSVAKDTPVKKRKKKKAARTVHKVQRVTELPSHGSKSESFNISVSSWRDGIRLARKILGPAPIVKKQAPSSIDGSWSDRSIKSASYIGKTESDSMQDVTVKSRSIYAKQSQSKMRRENNLKRDEAVQDTERGHHINKNLPVDIQGVLDDLQVDSVTQSIKQETDEENQNSEEPVTRSHCSTKKKSDELAANNEPQVTSKKRHYDTDEVRQYMVKKQRERKKKRSEQKKAQKEATEQKNRRLQELYKKQREALANKPKSASAPKLVPKQLLETDSKLLLSQALLEEPQSLPIQDIKPSPGYHPSEDCNNEDKMQEHPPNASFGSNMSPCESHHSLIGDNLLVPLWIQPDRLSLKSQLSFPQPSAVSSRGILDHKSGLQKDFGSLLSIRSHSKAVGSLPLAPPPITSTLLPTMNQYKSKLDRIEALKATAASLSSRIESEAKRLAGICMDYRAAWNSGHDLVQGNQGDGYWAKTSSPPVGEENDVFSARLQDMLNTCMSQLDSYLPELENPGVGKTISPQATAVTLPSEGVAENPSMAGSIIVPYDSRIDSISEQRLSDHLLSEEGGDQCEHSPLKTAGVLKEKESWVVGATGNEPAEQFQKEAENYFPISAQIGSASGPWEEITKGSPHSVINTFTKSSPLCGKGFEERSESGSPKQKPLLPVMSPPTSIVSYEDDFISSQGSRIVTVKKTSIEPSVCSSSSSLKEEVISTKLSCKLQAEELTHHSSGSPSASSCTSASSKRRGKKEKLESFNGISHISCWEENRMFTESDHRLSDTKTSVPSNRVSGREQTQNPDSDSTLEELSGHSLMSLPDKIRSPRAVSCLQSPSVQKQLEPVAEQSRTSSRSQATIPPGLKPNLTFPDVNLTAKRNGMGAVSGELTKKPAEYDAVDFMHISPAGLKHQVLAELKYLSSIEEALQQLLDVEQVQDISLVQQKMVSLAQIRKAQQEQHERDLAFLMLRAEQESVKSQRRLEEPQQKATQAHAESLPQLVQSREDTAEAVQETVYKIATQQTEAALLTADTAQELTEIAYVQNPDAVATSANPFPFPLDQKQKHHSTSTKKVKARSATSSNNSHQERPIVPFSKETKKVTCHEKPNSCTEEEILTAVNNSLQSIPSIPDERDSTSLATEYSLKFDSRTEDEIEEKSFRSLLPSEIHRWISLRKQGHHDYSDEKDSSRKKPLSPVKELNLPFSRGQGSFSKCTMKMVQQYMKEEEIRAAHQSVLLHLCEKALKEKTKCELAWLVHQEMHLRDKGEDDKMPSIQKKQCSVILKLQQEKAEIKRLQEANKAARKERQLILKQQEEIERIRQTTMKLQEKLKSAGENKLEHCSEVDAKQTNSSSPLSLDAETGSPSSVSRSETHTIMEKLRKMSKQVDEKFLTKREQKLMQRRQHAEELLQRKCCLDAEEAKIYQMEKQALDAWDKELLKMKASKMAAGDQNDQKETASEEDSSVPPCSCFNSARSVPEELGNLAVESGPSKVSEVQGQLGSPDHTIVMEEMVYTQDIETSASPGKPLPSKSGMSLSKQGSSKETNRSEGQQHLPVKSQEVSYSWSDESLSMTQSEATSSQSDIESRIRALKDELRKRKSVVCQLKREQKKRHKERLKAQEASLIKQLEAYDEVIKKTEAELSQDLEAAPIGKPQIKTPSSVTQKPKIKLPPLHRSESAKSWKSLTNSEHCRESLESAAQHIDAVSHFERSGSTYTKKFIEAEIWTEEHFRDPSPCLRAPQKAGAELGDSLDSFPSMALFKGLGDLSKLSHVSLNIFNGATSCNTNRSVIQEEVESVKSEDSELDGTYKFSGRSDASALDTRQKSCPAVLLKANADPEIGLVVTCVQDAKEISKLEECYRNGKCAASGQTSQKLEKTLVSEQLPVHTEPLYSNDLERSSVSKHRSGNGAPHTEHYKDHFDASASSLGKDSRSQGEKPWYKNAPRSRSTSIGSDKEISECLSDKTLSVASSIHSERLFILKSPTELMKSKERSDVEGESANVDSSFWAISSKTEEEENFLQDFSIDDRVLVSDVQPRTLRFKGLTNFAKGVWASVELDKPKGRNNGENAGEAEGESEGKIESEKCLQDRSEKGACAFEGSIAAEDSLELSALKSQMIDAVEEVLSEEQSVVNSLKSSAENSRLSSASISDALSQSSAVAVGGAMNGIVPEKWKQQQPSWQEYTEKSENLSPGVLEKSATPLLDLLTKERSQLEAQLRLSSPEEEESKEQQEKVGLLTDSLLQAFVKDTVSQLQQIRKVRNEKIQFSNQELAAVQEQKLVSGDLQSILSSHLDDGEEVSSPDLCPRPQGPIFCASEQEELARKLEELELSWEILSVLGDDQDWFDEDFGLRTCRLPPKQAEESAILSKIEQKMVPLKSCEEPLAVPHNAEEVEVLVQEAAKELWKCKELGHSLQAVGFPRDLNDSLKDYDIEAISKQIDKQAVFDLTREIFRGIFAEHPHLNQSIWIKPCRITYTFFPRVKDPTDLEEIKVPFCNCCRGQTWQLREEMQV